MGGPAGRLVVDSAAHCGRSGAAAGCQTGQFLLLPTLSGSRGVFCTNPDRVRKMHRRESPGSGCSSRIAKAQCGNESNRLATRVRVRNASNKKAHCPGPEFLDRLRHDC